MNILVWTFQHWSAPRHYLNQWWLVFWRIYLSLALNELNDQLIYYQELSKVITSSALANTCLPGSLFMWNGKITGQVPEHICPIVLPLQCNVKISVCKIACRAFNQNTYEMVCLTRRLHYWDWFAPHHCVVDVIKESFSRLDGSWFCQVLQNWIVAIYGVRVIQIKME